MDINFPDDLTKNPEGFYQKKHGIIRTAVRALSPAAFKNTRD